MEIIVNDCIHNEKNKSVDFTSIIIPNVFPNQVAMTFKFVLYVFEDN